MSNKLVTCKTCGKQIAKSARRCPYCGAKQHQAALTACSLIVAVMVVWIIATATNNFGSNPTAANVRSSLPSSLAPSSNYTVGHSAAIDSVSGQYNVTIDSVTESTKRNDSADSQPKRIVLINYSYKNISCKDDVTVSYLYFHAYDSSGKLLDVYPSTEVRNPARISKGKSNKASVAYGLDDSSKQITLDLYDVFNPTKRVATYTLNIGK